MKGQGAKIRKGQVLGASSRPLAPCLRSSAAIPTSPISELRATIVPRSVPPRGSASTALPSRLPSGSPWSTAPECLAPVGTRHQEQIASGLGGAPAECAGPRAARGCSPKRSLRPSDLRPTADRLRPSPPVSVGPTGRGSTPDTHDPARVSCLKVSRSGHRLAPRTRIAGRRPVGPSSLLRRLLK